MVECTHTNAQINCLVLQRDILKIGQREVCNLRQMIELNPALGSPYRFDRKVQPDHLCYRHVC